MLNSILSSHLALNLLSSSSTGLIVGLSVAGGVIVLLIAGVIVAAFFHKSETSSGRKHKKSPKVSKIKTSSPDKKPQKPVAQPAAKSVQPAASLEKPAEKTAAESAEISAEPEPEKLATENTSTPSVSAAAETPAPSKAPPKADKKAAEESYSPNARVRTQGLVAVRYDKSFYARLAQADGETKKYYEEIKSEILSYGAKSRMSWKHETFKVGGKLLLKIKMRGKTLCLYYPLSVDDYADTKYKVEPAEAIGFEDTPCLYRISNARRCKYAKDLIDIVAENNDLLQGDAPTCRAPAYESLKALLNKDLVREIRYKKSSGEVEDEEIAVSDELPVMHEAAASEVDSIMADEEAAALIESSTRRADKTRSAIINIDTISKNFSDGESVTLEEIKARIGSYNNATYLKVLARGTLDKSLTVEADDFSIEAVKMILLTGGKVLKTIK